jgi:hypothetical protein
MENNETQNNFQMQTRDFQLMRLKKIHRTQTWLAKQLNVNIAYISLYFNGIAYSELEERIEKRIAREERIIKERIEKQKQVA